MRRFLLVFSFLLLFSPIASGGGYVQPPQQQIQPVKSKVLTEAVLTALITGGFGFAGVVVTAIAINKKRKKKD